MADEFHTQPIDVPPELLHPATTQGVEGQQVYRDPDVMATLSRLRSAPSQVQVAGIDLLRATPAKPLDNDPFASLRESKKNDVPQLLPTAQPDQLAVIPTISVHDAPLSADDLSYELEITSMIERYASDQPVIPSADLLKTPMQFYFPPPRTASPAVLSHRRSLKEGYDIRATARYNEMLDNVAVKSAQRIAQRLANQDARVRFGVDELRDLRIDLIDKTYLRMLRDMQELPLSPDDVSIVATRRALPRRDGTTTIRADAYGSVGPMLIDDVLEYSTLRFAYAAAGVSPENVLAEWGNASGIALWNCGVPTRMLAGNGDVNHAIRTYGELWSWFRDPKNGQSVELSGAEKGVYLNARPNDGGVDAPRPANNAIPALFEELRKNIESLWCPTMVDRVSRGKYSFLIQPVDAGGVIPRNTDEMTIESREIPLVKVPIVFSEGLLHDVLPGGHYGDIVVTARDDVAYSRERAVMVYTAAVERSKYAIQRFDECVFADFLDRFPSTSR